MKGILLGSSTILTYEAWFVNFCILKKFSGTQTTHLSMVKQPLHKCEIHFYASALKLHISVQSEKNARYVHKMHDKVLFAFTDCIDKQAFTIKAGTSVSHVGPRS